MEKKNLTFQHFLFSFFFFLNELHRIHAQVEDVCGEVSRRAEGGGGAMGEDGRRRSIVEIHAEKMAEAKHMSIFEAKIARQQKKQQQKRYQQERNSLANFVK